MTDKKKSSANPFEMNTNWYELWMKQSKEFFDSAEKNLGPLFRQGMKPDPEEHMQEINQWMETLKSHWQTMTMTDQQKAYENYWKVMSKMCVDASDMMLQQWIKRSKQQHPIENIHELYELWLNCCNEVYKNSMHTKAFQDAYGDFMNAAIHFWKSVVQK